LALKNAIVLLTDGYIVKLRGAYSIENTNVYLADLKCYLKVGIVASGDTNYIEKVLINT
jgi:hypothetical protein